MQGSGQVMTGVGATEGHMIRRLVTEVLLGAEGKVRVREAMKS